MRSAPRQSRVIPLTPLLRTFLDNSPFVAVDQRFPSGLDRVRRLRERGPTDLAVGEFFDRHDLGFSRFATGMRVGLGHTHLFDVGKVFAERFAQGDIEGMNYANAARRLGFLDVPDPDYDGRIDGHAPFVEIVDNAPTKNFERR